MFKLSLKACRKSAGYKSQSEAAKALGMKERRYASLEREEVALTLEDAYEISVVFGCTPNDLCDWYATHPREETSTAPQCGSRLMSAYAALSEEGREIAENVVAGLVATYPQGLNSDELVEETA